MSKALVCFFVVLFSVSAMGQNGRLYFQYPVKITGIPGYAGLCERDSKDSLQLKDTFRFLDNIRIDTVVYCSDSLKISGILIQPVRSGKFPCIIFNRGGNEDFGELNLPLAVHHLAYLADKGFVVIASSYRGNRRSEGKDEFGGRDLNDILNLVPLLGGIGKADTSRIGMYGWSRGGMMTYMALTRLPGIKAAVVSSAPSDFFELVKERPGFEKNVLVKLIPSYEMNKDAELHRRSVIKWVDRLPGNVPLLIMHGGRDSRVSSLHALKLGKELSRYGLPHKVLLLPEGDHNLTGHEETYKKEVLEWFIRYL